MFSLLHTGPNTLIAIMAVPRLKLVAIQDLPLFRHRQRPRESLLVFLLAEEEVSHWKRKEERKEIPTNALKIMKQYMNSLLVHIVIAI